MAEGGKPQPLTRHVLMKTFAGFTEECFDLIQLGRNPLGPVSTRHCEGYKWNLGIKPGVIFRSKDLDQNGTSRVVKKDQTPKCPLH